MPPGGKRPGSGRKPHKPTPEQRRLVEELAAVGIPREQIASLIGLGEDALRRHYREQLDHGTVKANAAIGKKLYQLAMGGNVAAAIFWAKVRMGWRERAALEVTGDGGGPVQHKWVEVSVAPPKEITE